MTLNVGIPGSVYEVLRANLLGHPLSQTAWTIVGTIEPGAPPGSTTTPPSTGALYAVGEPAP